MSSVPTTTKPAKVTIELTVKVEKEVNAANAYDFKREIDEALEFKREVEGKLPEKGGAITGTLKIGAQKFEL